MAKVWTLITGVKKSVASFVGGTITWGYMVVASDQAAITAQEWLGLAVVAASSFGVYRITNTSPPDG